MPRLDDDACLTCRTVVDVVNPVTDEDGTYAEMSCPNCGEDWNVRWWGLD